MTEFVVLDRFVSLAAGFIGGALGIVLFTVWRSYVDWRMLKAIDRLCASSDGLAHAIKSQDGRRKKK